jgi:hypothetical protein
MAKRRPSTSPLGPTTVPTAPAQARRRADHVGPTR